MQLDAASLERLVPDELQPGDVTGEEALRISLERYGFAARYARSGRLLDVACGVGYGTRFLTDRAEQVTTALGVELSEDAVAYANGRYANDRTGFLACDGMQFEDAEGFDTIVSIETIEHLPDPEGFVERLVGLLRPGGHLVGSVPITPSVDANPHHLHDFTDRSFRGLVGRHGLEVLDDLVQDQPFGLRAVLTRSEARLENMRGNLPAWYLRHPGALLRRVGSTLRHGFVNRYLTVAWRLSG
ncbi:MAG: class I SAM-dependent methyltransferase [Deltaproteobacteria bacterium]|nr:class I SAM-dependent methyltransferase [Deltaproteobacteria bacterium]MBW2691249.1 class I SAM-dependent methyltransferase [Deltaproteobacteria bacterium]